MITPRATYRLQLNAGFTFADATALVPYLDDLGVSHAYLSPILKARRGSTHGYDTVDHTAINPELGTLDDFRTLATRLRERGMGIILDFVPNHMGVGGADNALWLDVLKNGEASKYAGWFDIDWQAPRADGKVLVPFLGTSYAESLASGHLRLRADDDGFAVWAHDGDKLPIRPEDADAILRRHGSTEAAIAFHTGIDGKAGSWAALNALIATQHWRLAHFSVAADEINYRRFFVNNDLAGIRIDRPEVFEHAHALIFSLIEEGLVDGLRIDHVDGLLDPKGYLCQLRTKCPRPIYLVVEKILAPHEPLRADWPVEGTTGYEVGTELTRVLMRPDGEASVTAAYADVVGEVTPFHQEVHRCKQRVMDNELAAELGALARRFALIAWSQSATTDLTESALRRALREVLANLSVYRTYADHTGLLARDKREISRAVALSRRSQPQIQPMVFDFVSAVLCGKLAPSYDPKAVASALGRFQQYSGPVTAKGLEDTALYRDNRLVALNEVGAHPNRFSRSIAAFHDSNLRRLATHPASMVATSTHDTKRGEDTRALIAAIADEPAVWTQGVRTWREMLCLDRRDTIHPGDLYLFFQLLLGGWPMRGAPERLTPRLQGAMQKSLREARLRSDWGVNNAGYEKQVADLVERAMGNGSFLARFETDTAGLRAIGRRKALIQAALKLTIPGVPDIYRGAEDWEQSFVDPDNRRPVDFSALASLLARPKGDIDEKLVLTQQLLHLRRDRPALFLTGMYEPIDLGNETLGFRRRHRDQVIVVVADLSRGHAKRLPNLEGLPTVAGSQNGPAWVIAN